MNVLIVGAGPTGLTAALELARRGHIPTIIDVRDRASTLSRAVGITPRSLALLSHSGVSEQLIDEGVALNGLRAYRGQALALSLPLYSERAFFPSILGLPQDRTESVLAERFVSYGGSIQYGVGLEKLKDDSSNVEVTLSDGSQLRYDKVIGADGTKSTVREQAGIAYLGYDLDQTWSIADVDLRDWRHPEKITLIQAGLGRVMVVAPIGVNRYRLVASQPDAIKTIPLPIDVLNVRRESTFKISVRQTESYSKGNIYLAGDAAHCHSPVGGRGMNLGIADAVELAKRIIEGNLADYSNVRHKHGAVAIRTTERGRLMASGLTWYRRMMFRTFLAAANALGPLKKRIGRFLIEF